MLHEILKEILDCNRKTAVQLDKFIEKQSVFYEEVANRFENPRNLFQDIDMEKKYRYNQYYKNYEGTVGIKWGGDFFA